MLQILETRLDNVVFHLGFANTRAAARQLVSHGHVTVNGRKVNVPSYGLKVNDAVSVKNSNVSRQLATKNLEIATSRAVPDWLALNKEEFKGTVMRIPTRDEIQPIANEQAVVEFYSRYMKAKRGIGCLERWSGAVSALQNSGVPLLQNNYTGFGGCRE